MISIHSFQNLKFSTMSEIFLNTVLLDNQRWTPKKEPSVKVSDYYAEIKKAGFAGLELWEFHYTKSAQGEQAWLVSEDCHVPIFNAYCSLEDCDADRRAETVNIAKQLGSNGIKFNVGPDSSKWDEYVKNLKAWRDLLPEGMNLLCECHPGMVNEEAQDSKRLFDQVGFDQMGIIVHPFSRHESLKEWMDVFGDNVVHTHFQMRDKDEDEVFVLFEEREDVVNESVHILKEEGFSGTHSIEFAYGTRSKNDQVEFLMGSTIKDLNFIKGKLL